MYPILRDAVLRTAPDEVHVKFATLKHASRGLRVFGLRSKNDLILRSTPKACVLKDGATVVIYPILRDAVLRNAPQDEVYVKFATLKREWLRDTAARASSSGLSA